MTKNGINIQTISTKQTEVKDGRVLLFRQAIKKAYPSHCLKFLLAKCTNDTIGFAHVSKASELNAQLTLNFEVQ